MSVEKRGSGDSIEELLEQARELSSPKALEHAVDESGRSALIADPDGSALWVVGDLTPPNYEDPATRAELHEAARHIIDYANQKTT